MNKDDIEIYAKSDAYFLGLIGNFAKNARIEQDITQQQLAESAGVNRATIVNLEQGKSVNLISLIQILRSLKKLGFLQELEVKPQMSPLQMAALEQKQRQRVRNNNNIQTDTQPKSDW